MKVLGVDVGGTYTDLIYVDEDSDEIRLEKVGSTPGNQSEGVMHGIGELQIAAKQLDAFVHGTTVGTNASIERKGAKCGLIATKGFRDIIEMRRRERITVWGLTGWFEPLITRDVRLEVDERTLADGSVLVPVSEAEVKEVAAELLAQGVEAVVIAFMHSYANPENELVAKNAVASVWPNEYVVASAEVVSEFREFERTTTAALNAYIQPLLTRYLAALTEELNGAGFDNELIIVQSNGGAMSVDVASRFAVNTITSGPAAGVIAAAHIGKAAGYPNIISMDLGGTSLDIAIIKDGDKPMVTNKEIQFGLPIAVPMLDINTVGAGGGSIAWVDEAGLLQIGPQSAGADPGPAAYGRGGVLPTVTDAHVTLGRVDADKPIGRELPKLEKELAVAAIRERIAEPLQLDMVEAAEAILRVASLKTAGSIRAISVERGHDPRDFTLVTFGGAGPLHATAVMRELALPRTLIPYYPGITSAMGCLLADVQHDFVKTIHRPTAELEESQVKAVLEEQAATGRALIESQGLSIEDIHVLFEADMRYDGQIFTIRPVLPSPDVSGTELNQLFVEAYQKKYGLLMEHFAVILVNLRTRVVGTRRDIDLRDLVGELAPTLDDAQIGTREVIWDHEAAPTRVFDRLRIPVGATIAGPCILEQPDTTVVLEPGTVATADEYGSLIVEVAK